MRFAVIENEFGESGVDEKVLSENVDEEVIEAMNGCICCIVRGDLVEALKRLYKRINKFDGVIIETTGLVDPAPVVQTFYVDEDIQSMYTLDSIVTVVDGKEILTHLANEKREWKQAPLFRVQEIAFMSLYRRCFQRRRNKNNPRRQTKGGRNNGRQKDFRLHYPLTAEIMDFSPYDVTRNN